MDLELPDGLNDRMREAAAEAGVTVEHLALVFLDHCLDFTAGEVRRAMVLMEDNLAHLSHLQESTLRAMKAAQPLEDFEATCETVLASLGASDHKSEKPASLTL